LCTRLTSPRHLCARLPRESLLPELHEDGAKEKDTNGTARDAYCTGSADDVVTAFYKYELAGEVVEEEVAAAKAPTLCNTDAVATTVRKTASHPQQSTSARSSAGPFMVVPFVVPFQSTTRVARFRTPNAGSSVLGPYFCWKQLGKGTFRSLHQCIDVPYRHGAYEPNTTTRTPNNSSWRKQQQIQP
jgi:hypothetical protein